MPDRPSGTVADGLRLAVTTFTVLPVRSGRIDRRAATVAMSVAPVIGAVLGALLAVVLTALTAAGMPTSVAATATVATGVLLTRGLHCDGLADTVDALGSYRSGPGALDIMRKPDIGPFGVAAIVLVTLLQVAAIGSLADAAADPFGAAAGVVVAVAAGRLAVTLACRRGVPAARPDGLGALVAGTVPTPVAVGATAAVAVAEIGATPARPWQGPLAVAAAAFVVLALVRHAIRRFGGVTGDVLGAAVEVGTTTALLVLVLG